MLIFYYDRESSRWKRLFGPMHLFCGENAHNELSDGFDAGVSVGLYVKKRVFFYDFLGLQLFKCVYVTVKNTFGYFFFFFV